MTQLATRDDARLANATDAESFSFVAQTWDDAWQFAETIAKSDLCPGGDKGCYKGKPANVLVAIQMGQEVGLKPMQALQSIAVIHGRPTLWGDGLLGVVRQSPLCEWIKEYSVGKVGEDTYGWTCEAKRVGDPNVISNTFTVADAKIAGLWGKDGPWKQYGTTRMCKMRARSWTCRDGFADVLKGLRAAEEEIDVNEETREAIVNAPTRRDAVKIALAARAPRQVGAAAVAAAATSAIGAEATPPLEDLDFRHAPAQELRDFFDQLAIENGVSPAELSAIVRSSGGFKRGNLAGIAAEVRGRKPAPVQDQPVGELVDDEDLEAIGAPSGAELTKILRGEAKMLGLSDAELEDVVNDHGGWLKARENFDAIVAKLREV